LSDEGSKAEIQTDPLPRQLPVDKFAVHWFTSQHKRKGILMYSETRPWGSFHVLDEGKGFKVKRIAVNPGGRLSLQSHKHRGEHWTVVSGIATVTVGETVKDYTRSQSIDIPQGDKHRLENHHTEIVEIIEVQFGDYLGEDDIIRYDDVYNRT
jgi:mannose-6-phosphate isomerase